MSEVSKASFAVALIVLPKEYLCLSSWIPFFELLYLLALHGLIENLFVWAKGGKIGADYTGDFLFEVSVDDFHRELGLFGEGLSLDEHCSLGLLLFWNIALEDEEILLHVQFGLVLHQIPNVLSIHLHLHCLLGLLKQPQQSLNTTAPDL